MNTRRLDLAALTAIIGAVPDPELPMITIAELGIVRSITADGAQVEIRITPTYSGCPAMDTIRADITAAAHHAGVDTIHISTELSPAWSTDDITPAGRNALAAAGIAPPTPARSSPIPLTLRPVHPDVPCPRCGDPDTDELSPFAATPCQTLRLCRACREPFDHMRPL